MVVTVASCSRRSEFEQRHSFLETILANWMNFQIPNRKILNCHKGNYTNSFLVESDMIMSQVSNCGSKILLTNDEAIGSSDITADCVTLRILLEVCSFSCY